MVRFKKLLIAPIGALVLMLAGVPAQAAPPLSLETDVQFTFYDFEHDLVAFWNITRGNYCMWADNEFAGDAPVEELVPIQIKFTGKDDSGALVLSGHATRNLELWNLPGADTGDVCLDTAGENAAWASGTAHLTANDNDLTGTGTRRNAFGDRAQGRLVDAEGGLWHYSWAYTVQCSGFECEDVVVRTENYNLSKRGR